MGSSASLAFQLYELTGGPEGWRGVPWTHDVVMEFIHAIEQLHTEIKMSEALDTETMDISPATLRQQN